jgi:cytochrome c oxidase assembly protein subunit 15
VIAAVVALLILLWVLWRSDAPAPVQNSGRVVLVVMFAQGIVGYTQFFTHLPAVLVGIHVLGASVVWAAVLWFHHQMSVHAPEVTDGIGDTPLPGAGQVATATAEVTVG